MATVTHLPRWSGALPQSLEEFWRESFLSFFKLWAVSNARAGAEDTSRHGVNDGRLMQISIELYNISGIVSFTRTV